MILAVLQARMSSTRLPGKVMRPILGEPMLFRQIERLKRARSFDKLVVATSDDPTDDVLAAACEARGVSVARGSRDDVLARFMTATRGHQPKTVIRLTGDCPLADPDVVDAVVRFFLNGDYDYVSNVEPPSFPDGLDAEVMRFSALERADADAKLPSDREHVTPYVRNHKDIFRVGNLTQATDMSRLRWTVDEPRDFAFAVRVYERLYPDTPAFTTADILALLAREPELSNLNADIERNAGFKASLAADSPDTPK